MVRAGLQRTLAAAGLSLVTGSAAVGLAIVGVGPLGEVAAGVRGAGAAASRGVLSVVMPEQAPVESQPEAPGGDSSAVRAPHPAHTPTEGPRTPPAPPVGRTRAADSPQLPDADAAAAEPDTFVRPIGEILAGDARTSGDQPVHRGLVDVLGHLNGLTSGALR